MPRMLLPKSSASNSQEEPSGYSSQNRNADGQAVIRPISCSPSTMKLCLLKKAGLLQGKTICLGGHTGPRQSLTPIAKSGDCA